MRILLVEPDDRLVPGLKFGGLFIMEPMALELLAGAVPEDEVKIVDLRLDALPLEHYVEQFKPDVVGVTGITALHDEMQSILRLAKSHSAFTVAGGPHASFAYEAFYNLDAVVIGEGEESFRRLIGTLRTTGDLSGVPNLAWWHGGQWVRNHRQIFNLWPLPRRCFASGYVYSAFGLEAGMFEATRGCPHRCTFCITHKLFKGRYRLRPVSEVVNYLRNRPEPFIMFPDADFLASPKYVSFLIKEIKKAGLEKRYSVALRADEVVSNPQIIKEFAQVGLFFGFIGYEGYTQEQLNSYCKGSTIDDNKRAVSILDKNSVISVGTLLADPAWDKNGFNDALIYARQLASDITFFSVLTPFPGTEISGYYKTTARYSKFDVLHAVTETKLPYHEFQNNLIRISRAVFLSKATLKLVWKLWKQKLVVNMMKALGRLFVYIFTIKAD